jgi:hypothetical protein
LQIRNIYAPPYHIENYVRLWETPRIQCIQNIGNPVHDSGSCHGECANIVGRRKKENLHKREKIYSYSGQRVRDDN